jgi:hypothetical protein
MSQKSMRTILVILVFTMLISACGGEVTNKVPGESGSAPDEAITTLAESPTLTTTDLESVSERVFDLDAEPNPASADITLEEGSLAIMTLGPEGGSFMTSDSSGTQYTLTVPEGALISPIEISMTAIASAEGEAMGDTFLTGVEFQPDGLTFLRPATLEMVGVAIRDDAVGFAAENGGQDLHLTPSESRDGWMSVTISHFSDTGAAEGSLADLLLDSVPEDDQAEVDQWLALLGDDSAALRVIGDMIDDLIELGDLDDYLGWDIYTERVFQAFHRISDEIHRRGWEDENPEGWEHLLERWQDLQDQWFKTSEEVLKTLAEECTSGNYSALAGVAHILYVAQDVDEYAEHILNGGDYDKLGEIASVCLKFDITWQATVTATGTGSDGSELYSDISLYAEARFSETEFSEIVDLQVDYITGIWDICKPTPGKIRLDRDYEFDSANFGILPQSDTFTGFEGFKVFAAITEPVYIDCSPAGFQINADAQAPFHGAALAKLNEDRTESEFGLWEYELAYDPVGVIIAQFAELYTTFTVSELEYELTQIVNVLIPGNLE